MFSRDTVDKVIGTYFAAITKEPFEWKGKTINPMPLIIRPKACADVSCPPLCGGCCGRNSLDYTPEEYALVPENYLTVEPEPRKVSFNGKDYLVYSDMQQDHSDYYCRYVRREDGRCDIHPHKPFAADFEMLKFFMSHRKDGKNQLTQLPFPRKWSYYRVDGGKGGLCQSLPANKKTVEDAVRRLKRLKHWTEYFELNSVIDEIIDYVDSGPHLEPLHLNQQFDSKLQHDLLV